MKYYKLKDTLNEKIIGNDYPQAYKFVKEYNPDAPEAIFSISKNRTSFPDYIPNLDGIMLSGSSNLTDFVSDGFGLGYIISEKAQNIIGKYNLCPHRFYPLGLYKRKIKHNYFLFRVISDFSDFVDYKKSTLIEYNIAGGKKFGIKPATSKEDLMKQRDILKKEKGIMQTIWGETIVMDHSFNKELDFFEISIIDSSTYISERLMNDIIYNGLTGWDFIPADNIIIQ